MPEINTLELCLVDFPTPQVIILSLLTIFLHFGSKFGIVVVFNNTSIILVRLVEDSGRILKMQPITNDPSVVEYFHIRDSLNKIT